MSLIGASIVEKIQFYEDHLAQWAAQAVQIGSSAAEIAALQTKTVNARAALTAQGVAFENAKSKTLALRGSVDLMMNAGSDVILKIRSKAATDGNTIYELANIPAPATPTPVGPPGTPEGLKVLLKPNGSIEMTWKCPNPANSYGTIYHLYRKVGTGEFTFIGGSGEKRFEDGTVPSGVPSVTYSIQAVRSTAVGDAAEFIVNFGVSSGGTMTASVVQSTPAKIAA